jgi:phosphate-selective porin OprO and OprP
MKTKILKHFNLKRGKLTLLVFVFFISCNVDIFSQIESDERPLIDVVDGLTFKKDSIFKLNLRFRMQNRFGFQSIDCNPLNVKHWEARVRRMRLRLDGYLMSRKLQYYVQLSFSRWDQNLDEGVIAQTVRDAILYYHVNDRLYFGFGQSKLPGNRQRVVSSGNLQFADRSIANAAFNIDRDFGFFGYYTLPIHQSVLYLKGAITAGEGRNAISTNNGLAYTGRIEYLPFGEFKNNTDYMEGDYTFTEKPKASFALTYSYNHKAVFSRGQLGSLMPTVQDLRTIIADGLIKYRGFALGGEYFRKLVDYSVYYDPNDFLFNIIPAGTGFNTQFSYCFGNMYEPAIRFAGIIPDDDSRIYRPSQKEIWAGVTKYLNGHRIKIQGNIIFNWFNNNFIPNNSGQNFWSVLFQVEYGL